MATVYTNVLGLVFVAGIVLGIKLMSSPETAVRGNLIGAVSMVGAIALTLLAEGIIDLQILWVSMVIGSAIGYYLSVKVAMIQMPQMVALLNGLGGGSSAIVSLLHFEQPIVRDISLCKQDIHMTGHSPCYRVNSQLDFTAVCLQVFNQ